MEEICCTNCVRADVSECDEPCKSCLKAYWAADLDDSARTHYEPMNKAQPAPAPQFQVGDRVRVEKTHCPNPCHACPGPSCGACEHCTDRPGYEPARYDLGPVARTWDHVGVGFGRSGGKATEKWDCELLEAEHVMQAQRMSEEDYHRRRSQFHRSLREERPEPTPPMLRDWRHGHWGL
jgi:hypothetical protein